jgi:hypothetical protein
MAGRQLALSLTHSLALPAFSRRRVPAYVAAAESLDRFSVFLPEAPNYVISHVSRLQRPLGTRTL